MVFRNFSWTQQKVVLVKGWGSLKIWFKIFCFRKYFILHVPFIISDENKYWLWANISMCPLFPVPYHLKTQPCNSTICHLPCAFFLFLMTHLYFFSLYSCTSAELLEGNYYTEWALGLSDHFFVCVTINYIWQWPKNTVQKLSSYQKSFHGLSFSIFLKFHIIFLSSLL